jgi:hypothetical protein
MAVMRRISPHRILFFLSSLFPLQFYWTLHSCGGESVLFLFLYVVAIDGQ